MVELTSTNKLAIIIILQLVGIIALIHLDEYRNTSYTFLKHRPIRRHMLSLAIIVLTIWTIPALLFIKITDWR